LEAEIGKQFPVRRGHFMPHDCCFRQLGTELPSGNVDSQHFSQLRLGIDDQALGLADSAKRQSGSAMNWAIESHATCFSSYGGADSKFNP
jgi:hypothetical protein